jgi:murein DD-endopeptidase MepM/ murein hydrolase activator NlpD
VDGVVVSKYGNREGSKHEGIDIAAPAGSPIWAARKGRVVFAGEQDGYGRIVVLEHDDDRVTIYAHNARNCVGEGEEVDVGDVIGLVGNSGGFASPAVHFEVRIGPNKTNPRRLLP